jgi:hypothetical protein
MEQHMAADPLDRILEADIAAAKTRMADVARQRDSWTAFDLKKHARNGWSGATMGLALYALLDEGRLVRGRDHRIRAPGAGRR